MTEQESTEFFNLYGELPLTTIGIPLNKVYDAIKARLKSEGVLNLWPEEERVI